MRHLLPILAFVVGVFLSACDDSAGPDLSAACAPAVRVDGANYTLVVDEALLPTDVVQAPAYAEVTRLNTDCADTPGTEAEPFIDGDSNFLPAGTTLHQVHGFPPTDRLAVFHQGVWQVLSSDS